MSKEFDSVGMHDHIWPERAYKSLEWACSMLIKFAPRGNEKAVSLCIEDKKSDRLGKCPSKNFVTLPFTTILRLATEDLHYNNKSLIGSAMVTQHKGIPQQGFLQALTPASPAASMNSEHKRFGPSPSGHAGVQIISFV